MGTRLEILARVRQLPDILGKKDHEIAEICGVTPQQWSNYKSAGAHNNEIPPYAALALWNAYGIPMEWIYDGQISRTPDQDMREKLTLANRRAGQWLAGSRAQPLRRTRMARLVLAGLVGAVLFHGSTGNGQAWERAGGLPIEYADFGASRQFCRLQAGVTTAADGYTDGQVIIYKSCMVAEGYSKPPG